MYKCLHYSYFYTYACVYNNCKQKQQNKTFFLLQLRNLTSVLRCFVSMIIQFLFQFHLMFRKFYDNFICFKLCSLTAIVVAATQLLTQYITIISLSSTNSLLLFLLLLAVISCFLYAAQPIPVREGTNGEQQINMYIHMYVCIYINFNIHIFTGIQYCKQLVKSAYIVHTSAY